MLLGWGQSGVAVFMTLIGGAEFFAGPIVGSVVYTFLNAYVTRFTMYWPLTIGLIIVFGVRRLRRWTKQIRQDGGKAMAAARKEGQGGQPVQISIFNGLLSLTFGSPATPSALTSKPSSKILAAPSKEDLMDGDILHQLKELAALRKAGDIDDQEFDLLKAQLIENSRRSQTDPTDS